MPALTPRGGGTNAIRVLRNGSPTAVVTDETKGETKVSKQLEGTEIVFQCNVDT